MPAVRSTGAASPYYVPAVLHHLGGWVARYPRFWIALGRLETKLHAQEIAAVPLRMPLFVCGLARSGSTLLHEIVASHPGLATHRVSDFPMLFTPLWWRRASSGQKPSAPRERAHGDRLLISTDSPDALEEMLWMAFFPRAHDPTTDNRLDASTAQPHFEAFYSNHLRKVLLAERGTRYVAKANYHIARLTYLARLFPDARFILPVRGPVEHIASLRRQHERFSAGQRSAPRALAIMQRSGHFEFGLDRRPLNLGDTSTVQSIQELWRSGEEVRGWARYWNMVHNYLWRLMANDPKLQAATFVVRYEAFCKAPVQMLRSLFAHCQLAETEPIIARFASTIQPPDYYQHSFTATELSIIAEETAASASLWGCTA